MGHWTFPSKTTMADVVAWVALGLSNWTRQHLDQVVAPSPEHPFPSSLPIYLWGGPDQSDQLNVENAVGHENETAAQKENDQLDEHDSSWYTFSQQTKKKDQLDELVDGHPCASKLNETAHLEHDQLDETGWSSASHENETSAHQQLDEHDASWSSALIENETSAHQDQLDEHGGLCWSSASREAHEKDENPAGHPSASQLQETAHEENSHAESLFSEQLSGHHKLQHPLSPLQASESPLRRMHLHHLPPHPLFSHPLPEGFQPLPQPLLSRSQEQEQQLQLAAIPLSSESICHLAT